MEWIVGNESKHFPFLMTNTIFLDLPHRDPYRAIISYWHLTKSNSYTQSTEKKQFQTSEFRKFVMFAIEEWLLLISDWVLHHDKLHVVFYEELMEKTDNEIRQLLQFLNLEVDETRMRCIAENIFSSLKREKTGKLFIPFSKSQHIIIDNHIYEANILLDTVDRTLPTHLYEFYHNYDDSDTTIIRGKTV